MKNIVSTLKLFAALLTLAPSASLAAGFAIGTQSARATGMGGAAAGSSDGPSSVFYNPAGLTEGKGIAFEVGGTAIAPAFKYAPPVGQPGSATQAEAQLFTPPTFYGTFAASSDLALGLGVFSPYGLGLKWPATFDGRFEAENTQLTTVYINPSVAYRLLPGLSLGVGAQIVRATVVLQQGLNFVDSEGSVKLGGATWGFGGNAGLRYQALDGALRVGATFRSGAALKFDGLAHFTAPLEFAAQLKDQKVSTEIQLPHSGSLGLAYDFAKELTLAVQLDYTAWSAMKTLDIHFPDDASGSLSKSQPRDWKNAFAARLGAEYRIDETFALRLGGAYDVSPSPLSTMSPSLPDGDRIEVAGGLGYRSGSFAADLGYQLILIRQVTTESPAFPATYSGQAHLVGLSLGYRIE